MERGQRRREEVLERVMAELEARHDRALSDLRRAGWEFSSVGAARRWWFAERTRRRRVIEAQFVAEEWQLEVAVRSFEKQQAREGGKRDVA